MPFATGVLARRGDLARIAQLLHGLCFDPIELDEPRLAYESRWSAQCSACAALWIASKAGKVMRIDLAVAADGDRPPQRWIPDEAAGRFDGAVRTMCHVHRAPGLGHGSFVLLGRDSGFLDIVVDARPVTAVSRFDLATWHDAGGGLRAVGDGVARTREIAREVEYTIGVTAIAVIAPEQDPDTQHILVATRYPRLHVIEARGGQLRLIADLAMPGWIDWILCGDAKRPDEPLGPDERITCISRRGDIVRVAYRELLAGHAGCATQLSLLPTAAMPFEGDLLLGTATGLFLVRTSPDDENGRDAAIALPVTHAPVLCLDRTALDCDCDDDGHVSAHDYITMGLEDGRLRVIDAELIHRLAAGDQRPTPRLHHFAIEMTSAVLAVETLRLDSGRTDGAPASSAYVMAVLRDHSVRLFQVTTQHAQHRRFRQLWEHHVAPQVVDPARAGEPRIAIELAAARAPAPAGCSAHAWTFALIDVVLPRLRELAGGDAQQLDGIVDLACELARRADLPALYQLSMAMDELCVRDAGRLLRLSRAVLAAVPPGQSRPRRLFIDRHLRDLNIAQVRSDHRPRLTAWTRFVRKYVLLGHTFETKRLKLRELVDHLHGAAKYLDGLIYQVRLAQQRYDVQWDARVDDEITHLHTVVAPALGALVVAVTVDARLIVFDRDGEPLAFADPTGALALDAGPAPSHALAPFTRQQAARTLASAVAADRDGFRAVLSCTLVSDPEATAHALDAGATGLLERQPRVIVIDVGLATGGPRRGQLAARIAAVDAAGERAEVHAIRPLPDSLTHFVVGLATDARPLGRLAWSDDSGRWELAAFPDSAVPVAAARSAPTRALAIERDDGRSGYLIVAGNDDGVVRVVSVGRHELDAAWQVERWDRVNDAITAVVLGAHPSHRLPPGPGSAAPAADPNLFSCYVGTASGDTFALSIGPPSQTEPITASRFGPYEAEPLWREAFDGPVLAIQRWYTPLFRSDPEGRDPEQPAEILVIATEKGRLNLYNHDPAANRSRRRVSVQSNYFFRGMRLDRVTLANQLRAVAVADGGREVVIARPHGQVSLVQLAYLLNTVDLDRAEPSTSRKSQANPGGKLPMTMPARQDHLFLRSVHEVPFRAPAVPPRHALESPVDPAPTGDDASVELKLALCNLVRIESGALSHYILDWAWSDRDRWDRYGPSELQRRVHDLLDPLDPEIPEQALRFKLMLKAVCGVHLRREPNAYRQALLNEPRATLERHDEVAVVCELVADHITRKLAYATRAAARLRITAIKELVRVPVLRHIAGEPHGLRIRRAIESALDACLRDDDRLVRIETLRALWVMLRNVSVMVDSAEHRDALVTALFPDGLGSLDWLVQRLIGGLQRAPSFTRRSALIGIAWFHISILLPVFRIFPRHTLALCGELIDKKLGIEAVAMCARSLRSHGSVELRRDIQRLYLLQALDKTFSRDQYIELYKLADPRDAPAGPSDAATTAPRPWFRRDNVELEGELRQLLDRMARLWEASEDMNQLPPVRLAVDSPYRAIHREVDELSQIARRIQQRAALDRAPAGDGGAGAARFSDELRQLAALYERYQSSDRNTPSLTEPIRTLLQEVVEVWQGMCSPRALARGERIGRYMLDDAVALGRNVFRLIEPAELCQTHVIRVFRTWITGDAGERFLGAARFTRAIREDAAPEHARHLVEISDIVAERPDHAYVMRRHPRSLEAVLRDAHSVGERLAWTEHAAAQLGRALRLIHRPDQLARQARGYHGDIKLSNIFLDHDGADRDPVFRLGGLAHAAPTPGSSPPIGGVPEFLRQKCQSEDELIKRQWRDIVALSWVLFQVLECAPRPMPDDPAEIDRRLRDWRDDARRRVALPNIIDTLQQVFDPGAPSIEIDSFLAALRPGPRAPGATTGNGRARPPAAPGALHRIRILHLSDLHHRGPRETKKGQRNLVLAAAWQANLAELRADGDFDLVALTGDVAFSGKPDEYELPEPPSEGSSETWFDARWFASTLEAVGCTREQLYIVPGNHDIDRALQRDAWSALRKAWSGVSGEADRTLASWFVKGSRPPPGVAPEWRDQVLERQSAYRGWLRMLGRPELVPHHERSPLGYRHRFRPAYRPFDVHIIGLDSAWLAGDDNDAQKLRLTEEQIHELCTDDRGRPLTGLRIALIHHPLTHLADARPTQDLLRYYGIGLLLSGHDHGIQVRATPEDGFLDASTGCLYEHEHYANACTAITMGLDDNGAIQELELRFRTWGRRGLRWYDDEDGHRDAHAGRFRWQRVR
jgi:hypothetical protein